MNLSLPLDETGTPPALNAWAPTRAAGLARLADYLPLAGRVYRENRNFDHGPGGHALVSTLSPWIRHRLVTEQEVAAAVLQRHSLSAAEKFIQEVCWRTYWKGWLELRPSVWRQYRQSVDRARADLAKDGGLAGRVASAEAGATGIDCFDAWADEVRDTGYLHNHARMWFASIWIFTLGLPWALGADFFLRHLLDGDAASNTLSWRWVAGLQTEGKAYVAGADNIAKFTDGRFRPAGQLTGRVAPLAFTPHPPVGAPPAADLVDRDKRSGLLLTDDDFGVHDMELPALDWAGALVVDAAAARAADMSAVVTDFTAAAAADAAEQWRAIGGAPATVAAGADADAVLAWARDLDLRQIVWLTPTTGPASDHLAGLDAKLTAGGVRLARHYRAWDRRAWPHATHGFFRFKKAIPGLVGAA
ncbi:MAG: FAD-binding domain-containing protein [Pseudomonadota bacterium]|nr:FAD-binding domain-containing protein [Pseudomonadota bacterium]